MHNTNEMTQEYLQDILDYDSETGVFIWLDDRGIYSRVGKVAGSVTGVDGSRQIMIDGVPYPESRLAWLYCNGTMPASPVYRLDKDAGNSSIANLTLVAPPPRKKKPHNKLKQAPYHNMQTHLP